MKAVSAARDGRFVEQKHRKTNPGPRWYRHVDAVGLSVFAAAVMFLHSEAGYLTYVGIGMVGTFVLANFARMGRLVRQALPLPPELILYSVWVIWTGLTGPIVAVDLGLFTKNYQVLVQMLVLVWTAYLIVVNARRPDLIPLGISAGAAVQVCATFVGGAPGDTVMDPLTRQQGTTSNPNYLGILMVLGVLATLWFWRASIRWATMLKAVILAFMPFATYVLLASGSRKATTAMAVVIVGWTTLVTRTSKGVLAAIGAVVIGGALVLAASAVAPYLAEDTAAGQRTSQFVESSGGDIGAAIESQDRFEMYVVGLEMFAEYPVFGVGLNNFQMHYAGGQYSHSDYIEPLATTGLLGFVLYQSFYVILVVRAISLLKRIQNQEARYSLKMVLLSIVTIMVIGFGGPHYTSQPVFLLLSAFSAYTWGIERQLRLSQSPRGGLLWAADCDGANG